eukprot:661142-Pelagomonas_calceolata.AAC.1
MTGELMERLCRFIAGNESATFDEQPGVTILGKHHNKGKIMLGNCKPTVPEPTSRQGCRFIREEAALVCTEHLRTAQPELCNKLASPPCPFECLVFQLLGGFKMRHKSGRCS